MNKWCLNDDAKSEENYYIKGYSVNYSTGSSKSDSLNSDFMNMVFDKSIQSPKINSPKIRSDSGEVQCTLSPDLIRERCKVAYECRNNIVCIEGNRLLARKK